MNTLLRLRYTPIQTCLTTDIALFLTRYVVRCSWRVDVAISVLSFFWGDGEREEEIALKQLYRALVRSSKISVLVLWAGNEWIRALGGGAGGVHGVEWQREMELHSRPSNSCPQLATTLPFQFQHFFTSCAKARRVRMRNKCCTYWDMGLSTFLLYSMWFPLKNC